MTFSGLLNALDGVAAGEERTLFMATNHQLAIRYELTSYYSLFTIHYLLFTIDYPLLTIYIYYVKERLRFMTTNH